MEALSAENICTQQTDMGKILFLHRQDVTKCTLFQINVGENIKKQKANKKQLYLRALQRQTRIETHGDIYACMAETLAWMVLLFNDLVPP